MTELSHQILVLLVAQDEPLTAGEIAAHIWASPSHPPVPVPVPGDLSASARNRRGWLEEMRSHNATVAEHARITARKVSRELAELTACGLIEAPSGPRVADWAARRVLAYGSGPEGVTRLLRSVLGLDIAEPIPSEDVPWTDAPEISPDVPGLVGLFLRILAERPVSRVALFPRESGADERKLGVLVSAGLVLVSGQRTPTDAGRIVARALH